MKTRSSLNWKANKPGGWDVLNTRRIFPSSNTYGIPDMAISENIEIKGKTLTPFHFKNYGDKNICHFFIDDYQFERVWNRPTVYIDMLKKYHAVLTPDFSLYTNYPHALNIWNTYRNRWLGCFWQENGIKVIPTIGWADAESYSYAFLGVPEGSIVAISPPDIRQEKVKLLFYNGIDAMISYIKPSKILSYGKLNLNFEELYEIERVRMRGGYANTKNSEN